MNNENKNVKQNSTGNKVLSVIGAVLCVILIPILIVNVTLIAKSYINKNEVPSFAGLTPMIVLSNSMQPEIDSGDLIICKITDATDVKVGDVISFFDPMSTSQSVVTHRVVEVIFLSILILLQCMLVATPVSADSAAVQARIDALPDASTLTKGQEPYATEILSLWDEVYTLSSTTEPAPDMTKLYAATHAVLTVSQQCWVITPRDGYQYAGSSAIRTYMVKYAGDGGAAFKEYLKDIFREINVTPQSSRPTGNDYNKLRNQVDGFFTPQDRIDSIIPTVDQINNMTDQKPLSLLLNISLLLLPRR